jgi:uncharacterized membrane protein
MNAPPLAASQRLAAVDWLRGFVMVLMAFDHASEEVNAGRLFTDSALFYAPGSPLPLAQFLARWMTHLCAPTFVFLAGVSLAIQVHRRTARGETALSIDRHLLVRGLVIMAGELWVSLFWMPPGRFLFQVLYAIGASFLLMVPLRRLPAPLPVFVAAAILVLGEAVDDGLGWPRPATASPLATLLLVPGRLGPVFVGYPVLPWCAFMLAGWSFGVVLAGGAGSRQASRLLVLAGSGLLALFLVVRGGNGFGNMGLLREGGSLVQWLHVSKYPPSLSFAALELGIATLLLAGLTLLSERVPARRTGLFTALGRTPMFFYLLHIPCLSLLARGLGIGQKLGLQWTFVLAAVVIGALYPLCVLYGRYKAAHPGGWTRYL